MPAKRILILTNRVPYPLNDGGNMATDAMIKGYASQGWEVYLLSMNTSRHYVAPDTAAGLYKDIYRFQLVTVNNDVTPLGVLNNLLFSSQPNNATRFMHKHFGDAVLQTIEIFKPDVVHIESVFLSGYLPAIRKTTNALMTLRLHNIEWQVWQRVASIEKNPFKKWYLTNLAGRINKYEQAVWQEYDALIPITEADAQVVRSTSAHQHIITIPFGIDASNVKQQGNENWCGYHIGAMDWLPNQDAIQWLAHDIWPLIQNTNPGFEFYFAGRNMPDAFESLTSAHFHCVREVPDAQAFIADKKILLVPLRSGGGIRVKILEAMAAGKLVISTAIGMQGIAAINGQDFLQADTPTDFAYAINKALMDKDAAEKIAINGAALVKQSYNATILAEKLSYGIQALFAKKI